MNVLSLFDGISCGQVALNRLGAEYDNYFASEVDAYGISVTKHNYPSTRHIGDVTKVSAITLPKIDLLLGGSPCQGFSFSGNQLNFNDPRSKLFFEYVRLLDELSPKYFLLENVPMKKEYQTIISDILKVSPITINSSLVSAQNRRRLYWTNIPNVSVPENKHIYLSSLVGEYDGIWVYPRGYNKGGVQGYKGKSPCVTTSGWQHNFFIYKDGVKRKFTIEEVEQLQTLPVGYTNVKGVSDNRRYKMLGNGWTVDVICHILKNMEK